MGVHCSYIDDQLTTRNGSIDAGISRKQSDSHFDFLNDLDLSHLERVKFKCKYVNQTSVADFPVDGKYNDYPISYRLRDICSRNMHDLDLDLTNWLRSNVNAIRKSCGTFYLMIIVMLAEC